MKTFNFKKLLCASLMLTFVVSCGKDQESGVPLAPVAEPVIAPVNTIVNPITNTSETLYGPAAWTNAQKWYNSTYEPSTTLGDRPEKRQIVTYIENCSSKTFLKYFVIEGCKSSDVTTTEEDRSVTLIAGNVKSSNAKLAAVYQPVGMTLLYVVQVPSNYGGAMFQVTYGKSNYQTMTYTIDTSFHSAFNPVMVMDSELKRTEKIMYPESLK